MKKKSNRIWWIVGGLVILLVGGLVAAKQTGMIGKPKSTEVDFATVKRTDITERVTASGRVQPQVEVKISPDVSGEIIGLYVNEGDPVKAGQLLVRIRPDNYESLLSRAQATVNSSRAQFEQTKAAVSQSEARLIRAKADYERNRKLLADKVISSADFETSEANYNVAKQEVEASRANVRAAQFNIQSSQAGLRDASENLRKTTIYAPVNGTVSKLNVELGERVVGTSQMAGTEIMRIANLQNMEVRVNVNENDIVRANLGDTADIEVDSYTTAGRKFKGIVYEIANTANGLTSSSGAAAAALSADAVTEFEVKVKILNNSYADLLAQKDKKGYPFKPGMTASVEIITDRKPSVLAVPIASVTTRGAEVEVPDTQDRPSGSVDEKPANQTEKKEKVKEIVFVNVAGKAVQREVKTGISDFENIEVISGLKPGEQIISGPFIAVSKRLKDGELVVKRDPNKAKKKEEKEDE
ncbi:efflux RND transporter periplasmic adaptor subunit [Spirosoma utsteinense]|uniref:HlyD family secretion protein n=1 Tax=Spirosoma utsteinense TaxID=2585773 RepID=A0ABR6W2K3_9BACT|nr:efflux RND transporter periplasmic adaptor subunit [Spirosoma utsteinense]MBC3786592.1 HlyD family secretion protein [Spirosoma utsteinense]MBC3789970.1 HlyD family secretion protein [Spirosoma utsteinense]